MKFQIVEDSPQIADAVSMALEMRWPEATLVVANNGEKAIKMAEQEKPDLIILDLGLPDIDGFEVLKEIRLFSNVPIIILTVRDEESDIVKCLERGADDYVTKPFRQLELMSRVQAIMRRHHLVSSQVLPSCETLHFGQSIHVFYVGKTRVSLTSTEGIILSHLLRNAGKVVSLSSLSEVVWGDNYSGSNEAIRVYIRRIRKKIEATPDDPTIIITHPGIGYSIQKPQ